MFYLFFVSLIFWSRCFCLCSSLALVCCSWCPFLSFVPSTFVINVFLYFVVCDHGTYIFVYYITWKITSTGPGCAWRRCLQRTVRCEDNSSINNDNISNIDSNNNNTNSSDNGKQLKQQLQRSFPTDLHRCLQLLNAITADPLGNEFMSVVSTIHRLLPHTHNFLNETSTATVCNYLQYRSVGNCFINVVSTKHTRPHTRFSPTNPLHRCLQLSIEY